MDESAANPDQTKSEYRSARFITGTVVGPDMLNATQAAIAAARDDVRDVLVVRRVHDDEEPISDWMPVTCLELDNDPRSPSSRAAGSV